MTTSQNKHNNRSWKILLLLVVLVGMLNTLSDHFFFRLDLTSDKRYSIHQSTKKLLAELKGELEVKIYLAGDLPMGFRQLQYATQELLTAFKAYSKYPIRTQIIDVNKVVIEERKGLFKKLAAKGIPPTNLYVQDHGQRTEKLIYPGALLTYQGQELGVMLLKGSSMVPPSQMINQSMENLEYELSQALARLVRKERAKIALIKGHGGPREQQLHGFRQAIQAHYELHEVSLEKGKDLAAYQALFVIKPQQAFSEAEKYVLDQYIMQGGKALFFLDRLRIDMDSLSRGQAFALPLDLNLDDQLFKYGIRIKQDLVQDLQAGVYPIIVGKLGNQPQLQFLPWPFFPILNHFANHLITKNLNPIYSQFVNSIDTVKADNITKTPLVLTSHYSNSVGMPVQVDLESLRKAPDTSLYNQGPMPVVYLLEGPFNSLYKNRLAPGDFDETQFIPTSRPTKILVAASGSLVLNALDPRQGNPLPWGYDPFLKQTFANEDLVLNAVSYMLSEEGIINTKQKILKLRYLDKVKVGQEKLTWQLINISLPILFLLLLGLVWNSLYRRIYTRF
jgi:gliding-associated putative ABC transporter substrate-binding component GldG